MIKRVGQHVGARKVMRKEVILRHHIEDLMFLTKIHQLIPSKDLGEKIRTRISTMKGLTSETALDPFTALSVLTCCVHFRIDSIPASEAALRWVKRELPLLGGPNLVRVVSLCSQLDKDNSITVKAGPLIRKISETLLPLDVTAVMVSFGQAEKCNPDNFDVLAENVIRNVHSFTPPQLVDICDACSKVRVRHVPLFATIEKRVIEKLPMYLMSDLESLLCSFSRLNIPSVELAEAIRKRSTTSDSGEVLSNLAKTIEMQGPTADFNVDFTEISSASGEGIAHILSNYKKLMPDTMRNICQRLEEILTTCTTMELTNVFSKMMRHLTLRSYHETHRLACLIARRIIAERDKVEAHIFLNCTPWMPLLLPPEDPELHIIVDFCDHVENCDQPSFSNWARTVRSLPQRHELLAKHQTFVRNRVAQEPIEMLGYAAFSLCEEEIFSDLMREMFGKMNNAAHWRTTTHAFLAMNVLEAMVKSKQKNEQLIASIAMIICDAPDILMLDDLCKVCQFFAQLRVRNEATFQTLGAAILDRAPTVSNICSLLSSLAMAKMPIPKIISQCLPRLRVLAKGAAAPDVTRALYAIASLELASHPALLEALCDRGIAVKDEFRYGEVASCLSSLRSLEYTKATKFVDALAERLFQEKWPDTHLAILTLSTLLTVELDVFKAPTFGNFVTNISPAIPTFNGNALLALAKAIAISGKGKHLGQQLYLRARNTVATLNPNVLCELLALFVRLGVAITRDDLLLDKLKEHVELVLVDRGMRDHLKEAGFLEVIVSHKSETQRRESDGWNLIADRVWTPLSLVGKPQGVESSLLQKKTSAKKKISSQAKAVKKNSQKPKKGKKK